MTRTDLVGRNLYDSIAWLFEVHLKEDDDPEYNYALLIGNEDSPIRIELWKDEPNFDTPADKIWYADVKLDKDCNTF
jgi:hypothetical protein